MEQKLAGKRILVVEDEYFIASDLTRALATEGAIVVGPVGDVARGLRLAENSLDAAILDVNLEGTMSYPIAERLAEESVPYMFLTGYDDWSLPAAYKESPRLAKPFSTPYLIDAVAALCAG
ncbi:MAG TPA: response regulator [Sphingobium sp.]|nr:response regulator [Sphingobium sp.]